MIQKQVEIKNRYGLHARPAAEFVKTASKFKSNIFLGRDDHEVNGKSIMGVMMLAAQVGSSVTITVDGEDEEAAMQALLNIEIKGEDKDNAELKEPLFAVIEDRKNNRPTDDEQ